MTILETLQITLSTSQMVFQSRMYTNVGTTLLESVYTLTQIFFSNSRAVRVGTTKVYRKKGVNNEKKYFEFPALFISIFQMKNSRM